MFGTFNKWNFANYKMTISEAIKDFSMHFQWAIAIIAYLYSDLLNHNIMN